MADNYMTKDQEIAVVLMALGYQNYGYQVIDRKMHMIFDGSDEVRSVAERYRRNHPIPVRDIRQVFVATKIWQSNLHKFMNEKNGV